PCDSCRSSFAGLLVCRVLFAQPSRATGAPDVEPPDGNNRSLKSGRGRATGVRSVKASVRWLSASGAEFSAGAGQLGCAHRRHYSATFKEWGSGQPLLLVPGLAGGFELLGPLARLLARDFRVISYQLRGEDDCFALRQRFGLQDLVTDLAEVFESLCLESPALAGVSFGGVVALEFAA